MRKTPLIYCLTLAAAGLYGPLAVAEGKAAICEFYNHGDFKRKLSGPCRISESKEETQIKLNNGEVYRLIPEAKREGHFVDQDGNRADIKHNNDWKRTYGRKNQRLIVQVAE
jgi:hypothetical protein